MLGPPSRIPKVVSVRVKCAEGLKIIPKSDHKQKKLTQKWKVHFIGGKKKMSTSSVPNDYGNPQWDYEVTFKLASKSDPIILLVTDSEDHHVGQVVLPLVALRPRPQNQLERPTDASRLQRADLEPTKKVSNPHGTLHFWIWVEEYRSEESDSKSSRGSMLSLSSSKHNRASSVADSLNYSGSVISLNSAQGEKKSKRHNIFKRHHGKNLLHAAAAVSTRRLSGMSGHDPSLSRSMGSVFDPTNRGSYQPIEYPHDDHDGSVLGAGSDLTSSEFYATGLMQRSGSQSRPIAIERSPLNPAPPNQTSIPVPTNRPVSRTPETARRISPVREDPLEQERAQSMQSARQQMSATPKTAIQPELLRLSPDSCTTAGGVEVTVYCSGLTDDMMRYASVLVDGYTVPRQDWFLQESGRSGQSELRIHMPERPTGRCWIELETMHHGRIRCPQEFQYVTATVSKESSPYGAAAAGGGVAASALAGETGQRPLSRMGSQRSSLLVRDRRSTRRAKPPTVEAPLTEANTGLEEGMLPSNEIKSSDPATTNPSITSSTVAPSPFFRRGSNRDSLSVVDRRSSRRLNLRGTSILPNKEVVVVAESKESNSPRALDEQTVNYSPSPSPYDPTGGTPVFSRSGSKRSSLIVSDRRSFRRNRNQQPQEMPENVQADNLSGFESNDCPATQITDKLATENALPEKQSLKVRIDYETNTPLTPVVEDSEDPTTPKPIPLSSDYSSPVNKTSADLFIEDKIKTLFPMNQTKRSVPNSDMDQDMSAVKKSHYSNGISPSGLTSAAEEPEGYSPAPKRLETDFSTKPFERVLEPIVSSSNLPPTMSNKLDNDDSKDLTPIDGINRFRSSNPPDPDQSMEWGTSMEEHFMKQPDSYQDSFAMDRTNNGRDVFNDLVCSPSARPPNEPDQIESHKTESLFSLSSLGPSMKPITSKSPSLIRTSHSRGSEHLSDSTPSNSQDEEIPYDLDHSQDYVQPESWRDSSLAQKSLHDKEDYQQSPIQKSGYNQALLQQDSGIESMKENTSPFVRTASQRSSVRVLDRRSTRRRPPSLLPSPAVAPMTSQVKQPESPQLSDENPMERYEASGEAGSESDQSPVDTFQGFSARRRNSHRSEASGQSRSILDEHSKLETETLRSMLSEANDLINTMRKQTLDLEKQLSEKSADVDRLSMELCKLRLRLLEGGATQYLEKCF